MLRYSKAILHSTVENHGSVSTLPGTDRLAILLKTQILTADLRRGWAASRHSISQELPFWIRKIKWTLGLFLARMPWGWLIQPSLGRKISRLISKITPPPVLFCHCLTRTPNSPSSMLVLGTLGNYFQREWGTSVKQRLFLAYRREEGNLQEFQD